VKIAKDKVHNSMVNGMNIIEEPSLRTSKFPSHEICLKGVKCIHDYSSYIRATTTMEVEFGFTVASVFSLTQPGGGVFQQVKTLSETLSTLSTKAK
jgi:hypothetical protein